MGKEKGPRHVAVAIVYASSSRRVLMVSSRKHPNLWICAEEGEASLTAVPKGGVEQGESSGQAAVREAWEEAGSPRSLPAPSEEDKLTELEMGAHPGSSKLERWHVHVLRCEEADLEAQWMEEDERNRSWFTFEEATEKIRQWYRDPSGSDTLQHFTDGTGNKKDRKGGAMETALRALIDKVGS